MNELITRTIEENEISHLAEFPAELVNDREMEIVEFVLSYNSKHGRCPSLRRIGEVFDMFLPYLFSPSEWEAEPPPVSDVFDQTVKRKLVDFTNRQLKKIKLSIEETGEVPLEAVNEIERIHTLSLGVSRYSTFDRDLYFRRSTSKIPFRVIDSNIGGLANGDYMLLIGRLGTGKSTLAQWLTKSFLEENKRILFISAEMNGVDVFSKIDAMVGHFNPLELRRGKTKEMDKVLMAVSKKAKKGAGEILIPRSRLMSPQRIEAFAKNLNIDMIFVDGVYLLNPSFGSYSSKWEKVATVSNELKQVALDLELPLIGTAQIKRGASGVDGYDPEDIAFSDALGQDADFVLAIYPNPVIKERMELQLIKNRYGPPCATQVYINFDTMEVIEESIVGTFGLEPGELETWTKK